MFSVPLSFQWISSSTSTLFHNIRLLVPQFSKLFMGGSFYTLPVNSNPMCVFLKPYPPFSSCDQPKFTFSFRFGSICRWAIYFHNFSFNKSSGQLYLKILHKHQFIKFCNCLIIFIIFKIPQAHREQISICIKKLMSNMPWYIFIFP